jgi:hypothetical protein
MNGKENHLLTLTSWRTGQPLRVDPANFRGCYREGLETLVTVMEKSGLKRTIYVRESIRDIKNLLKNTAIK